MRNCSGLSRRQYLRTTTIRPVLPPADVAAIERFCDARTADGSPDQDRIEADFGSTTATILERHAPWLGGQDAEWTSTPIARLRYTATRQRWTLQIPTTDGRWRRYEGRGDTTRVDPLLDEIDRDPTFLFWG